VDVRGGTTGGHGARGGGGGRGSRSLRGRAVGGSGMWRGGSWPQHAEGWLTKEI
jgi:hypothetical protein